MLAFDHFDLALIYSQLGTFFLDLQLHEEAREADLEAEDHELGRRGPRRQEDDCCPTTQGSRRQQGLQGSQEVRLKENSES